MFTILDYFLTIFIHASINTFGKAAGSALVPVCFVNYAGAWNVGFADIGAFVPHRPLEEASAAVASKQSVVFAGGVVRADTARDTEQNATW